MPPLDAAAQYAAPDTASAPPFTIGQRVGIARHPEHGSLRVTSVERHPGGGWRVGAGNSGYQTWASAETFVPWPEGVDEPPAPPFGCTPDGASPEAWERKRQADLADPEHGAAVSLWGEQMRRWLRNFST